VKLQTDPELLAHTAGRVLDAGTELADRTHALVTALAVGANAFGVLGHHAGRELDASIADTQGTLEQLAGLLQGDADKLYRAAFAAQAADRPIGHGILGPATSGPAGA
jgi:hypothetical protein